jgi:hypothetical protein
VIASQKAWCERVAFYDFMNSADYVAAYEHHFPGRSAALTAPEAYDDWDGAAFVAVPSLMGYPAPS